LGRQICGPAVVGPASPGGHPVPRPQIRLVSRVLVDMMHCNRQLGLRPPDLSLSAAGRACTGGKIPHLTWGDLSGESGREVIRGRSSEEAAVTAVERRAEEPKNGAREGTGDRRKIRTRIPGATTAVANLEAPIGRDGAAVVSRGRRDQAGIRGPFDRKPCTRS